MHQANKVDGKTIAWVVAIEGLDRKKKEVGNLMTDINLEYTRWFLFKNKTSYKEFVRASPVRSPLQTELTPSRGTLLRNSQLPPAPSNITLPINNRDKRPADPAAHLDESPVGRPMLYLKDPMDWMHMAYIDQFHNDGKRQLDRDLAAFLA
ncbi:hypothetical protein TorRG33x02_339840, partial [Trema orientale]